MLPDPESLKTKIMIGFALALLKQYKQCRQLSEVHQITNGHLVIIEDMPTEGVLKLIVEEVKSEKEVPQKVVIATAPMFNGIIMN